MKYFYCLFLFCISSSLFAQVNLVPNPSFEDTLGCPNGIPDLDGKCMYWQSYRYSPDYFNNCSSTEGFQNSFGYQVAHTGQAFVGLVTYQVNSPNAKEQIGIQLTAPLVIGQKYFLTFYASLAYNSNYANIASNKLGANFSTTSYSDNQGQFTLPNSAKIFSDSILTDTLGWNKISGSFIADSSYLYLILGGFFNSNFMDTVNLPYQIVNQASYYYIDDVCLSTDSITCSLSNSINSETQDDITLVYNANFSDHLEIISKNTPLSNLELLSISGQLLCRKKFLESTNNYFIYTNNYSSGVYILKISIGYKTYFKRFFIHN